MTGDTVMSMYADYYADSHISFDEMESLIEETKDQGYIGPYEVYSLKNIINNSNMPDYVRYLARQAIMGSEANTFFQGNIPLGNLKVGSASSQIDMMLDKWFRGKDLPRHGNWNATYKEVEGDLIVNGISQHDVRQGRIGDCYLIASLRGVAESNPDAIKNMFLEVGEDLWVVRWFHKITKEPHYVTVNNELPVYRTGRRINERVFASFGDNRNHHDNPNNELWGALAEKSYAQVSQISGFRRLNNNSYQNLRGGNAVNVYVQISKVRAISVRTRSTRIDTNWLIRQVDKWDNAVFVPIRRHTYNITHYNSQTGKFRLDNPWGTKHLDLTLNEIRRLTGGYFRIFRKSIVTSEISNQAST